MIMDLALHHISSGDPALEEHGVLHQLRHPLDASVSRPYYYYYDYYDYYYYYYYYYHYYY